MWFVSNIKITDDENFFLIYFSTQKSFYLNLKMFTHKREKIYEKENLKRNNLRNSFWPCLFSYFISDHPLILSYLSLGLYGDLFRKNKHNIVNVFSSKKQSKRNENQSKNREKKPNSTLKYIIRKIQIQNKQKKKQR